MMVIISIFGKATAVLVSIPEPVIGGVAVVALGTFVGVIFSNLQYIDLNSSRNLAIIGISLLIGLMVPGWTKIHATSIETGIRLCFIVKF